MITGDRYVELESQVMHVFGLMTQKVCGESEVVPIPCLHALCTDSNVFWEGLSGEYGSPKSARRRSEESRSKKHQRIALVSHLRHPRVFVTLFSQFPVFSPFRRGNICVRDCG